MNAADPALKKTRDSDRPGHSPGDIRFAADVMVGRLARWLRVLGYDTFYDPGVTGTELVERAIAEGRVLLTRSRRLVRDLPEGNYLILTQQSPAEQLVYVWHRFGLNRDKIFTRCTACNVVVVEVPVEFAAQRVPPRVVQASSRFYRCPRCGKVFWEGTHRQRFLEYLSRLEGQIFAAGEEG